MEDGNIKAAIRILNSDDEPANPAEEILFSVKEKPPLASKTFDGLSPPSQFSSMSVIEQVRLAMLSFPAGSAGGPDLFRPQHLRDLLLCRELSPAVFMSDLTAFLTCLCQAVACQALF